MLTFLFWLFGVAAVYSYFIYPVVLRLLVAKAGAKTNVEMVSPAVVPSVTLIVTAYNEEARVRAKIENSLQLMFDAAAFEIIIASDCSADATDDIVREYTDRGVRLVRAPERLGKEHAQQCAIKEASGDILVFSDVATEIPADAIQKLVRYFNDPGVGRVQ